MTGFRLRAHEKEDAAAEFQLLMRPKVRWGTMVFAPFTSEAEGKVFMEAPVNGCEIVAVSDPGDVLIAHVVFFRNKGARSHGGYLGLAVHDEWHRRGVGSALMAALLDVTDNWLGITRVTLNVFTDNAPAIALYQKFGFEIEGTLRNETLRDGKYIDAHSMARLRPPPRFASAS